MIIEALLLIVTGLTALIVQMIYFLIDDRNENNTASDRRYKKYWHLAGGAIHVWMGYAIYRITGDCYWGMLMGALTWILFDGFINTYVLHREWWYIGDTAMIDIVQHWIGRALRLDPRAVSACLKCAVLIASILLLIPNLL